MGVSIRCPREKEPAHHEALGDHRLELWFSHPDDGFDPNHDKAPYLFSHMGSLHDEMTIYPARRTWPEHLIDYPGHWRGYIVEGIVYDALR
jgi:hypothetical protein